MADTGDWLLFYASSNTHNNDEHRMSVSTLRTLGGGINWGKHFFKTLRTQYRTAEMPGTALPPALMAASYIEVLKIQVVTKLQ